ncbi:MAG: transketolase [Myxococcota bacterium]|nr:transketolase [Myxococcota bacterium]
MSTPAIESLAANTIRGLAMDAIQKANSGHPGAPMGMADIAVALWGHALDYDPAAPDWADRDRVVLSNGHASMLLYSVLHLTGTSLSLDDIKAFRQWGAKTAGHPEFGYAPGIETTTGPLGQGFANGVGMALAEARLRAEFGEDLVDHMTYVLAGDGCLMEGVAYEAASLAGHLGLGKLVCLYDDNKITIDGTTDLAFSEDVRARFEAMGWGVEQVDGHDRGAILAAIGRAKADHVRPTLISCRTTIGFGAPNLAGSNKTHGSPLGDAEIAATKSALGMDPDATFAVPADVPAWFQRRDPERKARRLAWEARLAASGKAERWARWHGAVDLSGVSWPEFEVGTSLATRKASAAVLNALAAEVGQLLGGSADLAGSNGSTIKGGGDVQAGDYGNRNLHFGIREHAMAGLCNGLALHGGVRPYCATFLVFHDYMRPAVRLAALMHQPVIYIYTHDSIFLGEDGPTHQPVEHLMAMRTIPGLWVLRPADAAETAEAWRVALERTDGPVALALTRQGLPVLDRGGALAGAEGLRRGGYVLSEAASAPAVVLIATGSEVALALESQAALAAAGVAARVVSMPSWELFRAQGSEWQTTVLPTGVARVSIEAGTTLGWQAMVGLDGASVGIDRFGASAPGKVVAEKLGLTVERVVAAAEEAIARKA